MPPIEALTGVWILGRQIELTWRDLDRPLCPGREALTRTHVLSMGRGKPAWPGRARRRPSHTHARAPSFSLFLARGGGCCASSPNPSPGGAAPPPLPPPVPLLYHSFLRIQPPDRACAVAVPGSTIGSRLHRAPLVRTTLLSRGPIGADGSRPVRGSGRRRAEQLRCISPSHALVFHTHSSPL
jgi:hypothetical protein